MNSVVASLQVPDRAVPALPDPADLAARGLSVEISDAVATVTLSRPERRNAMTPSMWHGLAAIGAGLPAQVRVVLVRGAGPSFCAGIDLRLFSEQGVPGEDRVPSAPPPVSRTGSRAARPDTPGCGTPPSSRWPSSRDTRSAPAVSSRCPVTCGCWRRTPACA